MNQRPKFDGGTILRALVDHGVDFVLVGGTACIVRGSARPSFDIDIAYSRDRGNLERLAAALRQLGAYLRGAPHDVPFILDAETLAKGSHFTFETPYGSVDILHDPDGAPRYDELRSEAGPPEQVEGVLVTVASIDHLISMKEAAGRPHDKVVAMELRTVSDLLRAPKDE